MKADEVNQEALEALHDTYKVITQIGSIHIQQLGLESDRKHYPLRPREIMMSILTLSYTHGQENDTSSMLNVWGAYPVTMVSMWRLHR